MIVFQICFYFFFVPGKLTKTGVAARWLCHFSWGLYDAMRVPAATPFWGKCTPAFYVSKGWKFFLGIQKWIGMPHRGRLWPARMEKDVARPLCLRNSRSPNTKAPWQFCFYHSGSHLRPICQVNGRTLIPRTVANELAVVSSSQCFICSDICLGFHSSPASTS